MRGSSGEKQKVESRGLWRDGHLIRAFGDGQSWEQGNNRSHLTHPPLFISCWASHRLNPRKIWKQESLLMYLWISLRGTPQVKTWQRGVLDGHVGDVQWTPSLSPHIPYCLGFDKHTCSYSWSLLYNYCLLLFNSSMLLNFSGINDPFL